MGDVTDRLPRLPSPNPIRDWSGVLDLSESIDKHVRPQREQLASGRPHEREFEIFARLEGLSGLFVDVGANVGQSAISFRCVNRSMRVASFEPNPVLEPLLRYVRDHLLEGFEYQMIGVSDVEAVLPLYIPVVDNAYVTPLASMQRDIFERKEDRERLLRFSLHGGYEVREVPIRLKRLDSLGLEPTVVKVDAEEHELRCLAGMVETLKKFWPLCMFESNSRNGEIIAAFAALGYRPFAYDPERKRLVPYPAPPIEPCNIFYVPAAPGRFRRRGLFD